MSRDESIAEVLRAAGLRRTPVRVAVLALVGGSKRPVGAADVLRRLGDGVDSVTVYRTLNTLAEHKLVHRVRGEDGAWRYAGAAGGAEEERGGHSHAHFVCDGCGQVECLEQVPVPAELAKPDALGRRYDVTYAEVLVHGLCPRCH